MAKYALLVGISEYGAGLEALPAAKNDAEALHRVLLDPKIGEFAEENVKLLINPSKDKLDEAIYELFSDRHKDDLVLFYFSGHGITDQNGVFYFSSCITRKDSNGRLVPPTAVIATDVHRYMQNSQSKRQVVILDCCFGSAFVRGMTAKDTGTVNVLQQLGGKGRAILTASNSVQYAFEQKGSDFSIYSRYLIEGLATGIADRDGDGYISVDELHDYVRERVKETTDAMTPEIHPIEEGYKILLAKSAIHDPKLIYRKEVERRAKANQGGIEGVTRRLLDAERNKQGLSIAEATGIEAEVLQPYREYEQKLQEYEAALVEEADRQFPLSPVKQREIAELAQYLGIREEEIASIHQCVLAPRQAEYDRQLNQQRQQQLAQQQQRLEQQRREQEQQEQRRREAEELLQQELGQSRQQKQPQQGAVEVLCQILERERQSLEAKVQETVEQQQRSPTTTPAGIQTFAFQTAVLKPTKETKPVFLGFGQKEVITYAIERKQRRASFFVEDLGDGVSLEMVAISGGSFKMGSPESEEGRLLTESPQHPVTVKPFFMGKVAVTQAQWRAIASLPKINLDLNPDPAYFKGRNRPVEQVSWLEAVEFCDRLSRETNRKYRLPSEAEWEYACRAGTTTPFHFGETITTDLANYRGTDWIYEGETYPGNYGSGPKGQYREETMPVGSFAIANAFGLCDMHGNIWEWCADHWHENYQGAPTDGSVWLDGNNSPDEKAIRLLRGGCWVLNPGNCRSSCRNWGDTDDRGHGVGFRLALSLPGL